MITGRLLPKDNPSKPHGASRSPRYMPDPLRDAFQELRAELIRREADAYPALQKGLYRQNESTQLEIHTQLMKENEEDQLRDFVMRLEDNSYGCLFWEVEDQREADFLNTIDVACTSIEDGEGLLP